MQLWLLVLWLAVFKVWFGWWIIVRLVRLVLVGSDAWSRRMLGVHFVLFFFTVRSPRQARLFFTTRNARGLQKSRVTLLALASEVGAMWGMVSIRDLAKRLPGESFYRDLEQRSPRDLL